MPLRAESIIFDPLATDPSSPEAGRLWFNTAESVLKLRENGLTIVLWHQVTTAKDDTSSGTTSSTFIQKLRETVVVPAGDYIVFYQVVVSATATSTEVEIRIQLDDTTDLFMVNWIPGVDHKNAGGGLDFLTLGAGSHDFDIDWRKAFGSGTASIEQARLAVWRTA